jgi:hypothetical protein
MGPVRIFISLAVLFLMSGCGANPFGNGPSTVSLNYGPSGGAPTATNIGTISGSLQSATTLLNAKASLSVGSPLSSMRLKTANGATAFLSIQGQILSK